MLHHEIPLPLVNDLKCRHCSKFVSCGPVHVVPDGSILCGRCRALAKPKFRNYSYEAIARIFMYPCCYWSKHCPRILNWNECLDHERNCVYNSTCQLLCTHPGVLFKSDRKILNNVSDMPLEQTHVTEEILDVLKCVACGNYLSCDPVYIGYDGRNICHRCTTSNGVPKGVIRNLSYERIASAVIFPCIYRFRGCTIRLNYGRNLWQHETECSYGQIEQKQPEPKKIIKNGKEKGVIPTHSGHYFGTITPHSAPPLFAPPIDKNHPRDSQIHHELENVIRKKHSASPESDEVKTPDSNRQFAFDTQSFESIYIAPSVASSITKISQEDVVPESSRYQEFAVRTPTKKSSDSNLAGFSDNTRKFSNQESLDSISGYRYSRPSSRKDDQPRFSNQVRPPGNLSPMTPPLVQNGHYRDNIDRWIQPQDLYHYPPLYLTEVPRNQGLQQTPSFNKGPSFNYSQEYRNSVPPRRTESIKVGNQDIINELKKKHKQRHHEVDDQKNKENDNPYGNCNNLQDIVQTHDKVFVD